MPAISLSCLSKDHLVGQVALESNDMLTAYLTPNSLAMLEPRITPFPKHLPLPRLVRHCPNLRDHALERLSTDLDRHATAYTAIIIANLFPNPEDAVRKVVRAVSPEARKQNVLEDLVEDCATEHGNFGSCSVMEAAIRAENGGRIPRYPYY